MLVAGVTTWFYMIFCSVHGSLSFSSSYFLPLSLSLSREIHLGARDTSRVGVKRAILMHLFMGVIKISARQREQRSYTATRSLSQSQDEVLSRVPLARTTASAVKMPRIPSNIEANRLVPPAISCVASRFWSFYARVWEDAWAHWGKNMRRHRCTSLAESSPAEAFMQQKQCQEMVTSNIFYWRLDENIIFDQLYVSRAICRIC